jgi:hypothetical protein
MSSYDYWDAATGEGLTDSELHERYDDLIDEISGDVQIGNLTYQASRVLKTVDPIAYNVGFNEWLDNETYEGIITEDEPEDDNEDDEE